MKLFRRKPKERTRDNYGDHPNDFEHTCAFPDQIRNIGRGTKNGSGEEVEVDMQSGQTAIYRLFADRVDFSADDTGQRHWRYCFVRYKS